MSDGREDAAGAGGRPERPAAAGAGGRPERPAAAGPAAAEDGESALRAPLLRSLLRIPLKKVAIWGAFLGLLYVLWDFFGLIFLTFVLAYITSSIVDRVQGHFSSRKVPVVLVFALIVGAATGICWAAVVRAVPEAQEWIDRFEDRDLKRYVEILKDRALGRRPVVEHAAALQGGTFGAVYGDPERRGEHEGLLAQVASYLADPERARAVDQAIDRVIDEVFKAGEGAADAEGSGPVQWLQGLVGGIIKAVVYILLGLLFSFMIVWDAPRLGRGLTALESSRLGEVFGEVAPSIATFARLLGRAFEAQTAIAVLNTVLTALGLLILGVPGIGFLSVVVFLCSFVPIVGVYASTLPMLIVALREGGVVLALGVIVMVTVVHVVEAYVLNPRIYGAHMKLHPLVVLVVLFLGQHLLGLWGLILAVPLATYVWRHLILGEAEHVFLPGFGQDPAPAAEPEPAAGDGEGAADEADGGGAPAPAPG